MYRRLPRRLCVEEVIALGGYRDRNSITIIVAHHRLPVLGGKQKGCQMWFSTTEVEKRFEDVNWLDKTERLLREHTNNKNGHGTGISLQGKPRPLQVNGR